MTATVDEMRRVFGSFEGDTANLPPFDEIFPGHQAPVLRRKEDGGLKLDHMKWGFPGPPAAGLARRHQRPQPRQPVLAERTPGARARRCIVPVTSFCEWTGEVGRKTKVWFGLNERA